MNEKLSYCSHVIELVRSHFAEQKSMRIEILIVLLILIEVMYLCEYHTAVQIYSRVVSLVTRDVEAVIFQTLPLPPTKKDR